MVTSAISTPQIAARRGLNAARTRLIKPTISEGTVGTLRLRFAKSLDYADRAVAWRRPGGSYGLNSNTVPQ